MGLKRISRHGKPKPRMSKWQMVLKGSDREEAVWETGTENSTLALCTISWCLTTGIHIIWSLAVAFTRCFYISPIVYHSWDPQDYLLLVTAVKGVPLFGYMKIWPKRTLDSISHYFIIRVKCCLFNYCISFFYIIRVPYFSFSPVYCKLGLVSWRRGEEK